LRVLAKASMCVCVSNSPRQNSFYISMIMCRLFDASGEVQSSNTKKCKFMILEEQNFLNLQVHHMAKYKKRFWEVPGYGPGKSKLFFRWGACHTICRGIQTLLKLRKERNFKCTTVGSTCIHMWTVQYKSSHKYKWNTYYYTWGSIKVNIGKYSRFVFGST
jgi:hypothetical protein